MEYGQRVKVYGAGMFNGEAHGDAGSERNGTVTQCLNDDGNYVGVTLDGYESHRVVFHIKQCRKLKKKSNE